MSFKVLFALLSFLLLTGCICPPCPRPAPERMPEPIPGEMRPERVSPMSRSSAPMSGSQGARPPYHMVQAGENLYRIGLRYGLRPEEIMEFNGLLDTRIVVGQMLRLSPSAGGAVMVAPSAPRLPAPDAPVVRAPTPSPTVTDVSRISADQLALVRSVEGINWRWPTSGNVVGTFRSDDVARQGLAIAGNRGQQILAAADGVVTYQGEALASYGKLLIIKHDDQFLTAYAHNENFLVKEGDRVRAGQPIASMGNSGAERVQLGFEVRKGGNPVDPFRYLPDL